jgi:Ras-related protein Rab-6A
MIFRVRRLYNIFSMHWTGADSVQAKTALLTFLPYPTDAKSFQNTRKWIDDVRAERGHDVIIVLVGNKTDLNDKREVTTQQGEEEAKKHNLMFVETSAKLGHNVKTLFKRIAQALPGMEGSEAAAQASSQMIDVKTNTNQQTQEGCSC